MKLLGYVVGGFLITFSVILTIFGGIFAIGTVFDYNPFLGIAVLSGIIGGGFGLSIFLDEELAKEKRLKRKYTKKVTLGEKK